MMDEDDPGLVTTRRVRERISRWYGNDPRRLVEHYMEYQKQFADRLRPAPGARRDYAEASDTGTSECDARSDA